MKKGGSGGATAEAAKGDAKWTDTRAVTLRIFMRRLNPTPLSLPRIDI